MSKAAIYIKEEIVKLISESFDAGAKAAMESLINSLEKLYILQPEISFPEVINLIKEMKDRSKITNP